MKNHKIPDLNSLLLIRERIDQNAMQDLNHVINTVLSEKALKDIPVNYQISPSHEDAIEEIFCQLCNVSCTSEKQLNIHKQSKNHIFQEFAQCKYLHTMYLYYYKSKILGNDFWNYRSFFENYKLEICKKFV